MTMSGLYPSDTLYAYGSYYSKDDFSGRAVLGVAGVPAMVDLFIQDIALSPAEHIQLDKHMGNTFSIVAFGKAPLVATLSGVLVDTPITCGRAALTELYIGALRLEAVARSGLLPTLAFLNAVLHGPLVSLGLEESAASEDTLRVSMDMLVFTLQAAGAGTSVLLDYAHGMETLLPGATLSDGEAAKPPENKDDEEVQRKKPSARDETLLILT